MQQKIEQIQGLRPALDGKADVNHGHTLEQIAQSGANVGQVPKWNGLEWVPDTAGGGADGKTILNGTAAPDNSLGSDGDFYIRTSGGVPTTIYGPKASGVWPSGVSVVGPQGPTGATGDTGPQGPAGNDGADGQDGAVGQNGAPGQDGVDGKSAYEVAVDNGFTGSAQDWLDSLVGPQGPTGATGATGPQGETGPQGPAGPTGPGADVAPPENVSISVTTPELGGAVPEGEEVVLSCDAVGSGLSYQWYRGVTTVGSDSPTFTIAAAADTDAGEYSCEVTNQWGAQVSNTLELLVLAPPSISSNTPPDEVPDTNSFIDFAITADGGGTLVYQWQKKDEESDPVTWSNVSNGGSANVSGATTNTMTLQATASTQGTYHCKVTNELGVDYAAYGNEMTFYQTPPTITQQPDHVGSEGTTSIEAEGVGELTYQWLYGGIPVTNSGGYGSRTNTLDVAASVEASAVDLNRGLKFSCRVSNPYGSVVSEEVSCRPFLLGSNSGGNSYQRANGVGIILTAGIVGPPGTTYSWKRNGTSCGGDTDVFGDSVPRLTIKEPQMGDEGNYVCRGSNAHGYVDADGIDVDMVDNDYIHKLPRGTPQLRIFNDETLETEIVALMPVIEQVCGWNGCVYEYPKSYQFDGAVVPMVDDTYDYSLKQGAFVRRALFTPPAEGEMAVTNAAWKTMAVSLDGSAIPSGAVWKFLIRRQSGSAVPNSDPTTYYIPIEDPWVTLDGPYVSEGVYANDSSLASFQAFVITKAAIESITEGPLVFVLGGSLSIDVYATGDNLLYAWYRDGVRCPMQSGPNFSKLATEEDAGDYTAKVGNESYITQHCVESDACEVEIIGIKETPASFTGCTEDTVTAVYCGTNVEFALVADGAVGTYQDSPTLEIGDNFGVPLKIRIRHKTETDKYHDSGEFTVTQIFKWKVTSCGVRVDNGQPANTNGHVTLGQVFPNGGLVDINNLNGDADYYLPTATAVGTTNSHTVYSSYGTLCVTPHNIVCTSI